MHRIEKRCKSKKRYTDQILLNWVFYSISHCHRKFLFFGIVCY